MQVKNNIKKKTDQEIEIMVEGGIMLSNVNKGLKKAIGVGVSAWDIEVLAEELIKKEGGVPSFKKVEGYSWATCININEGIVHGIPKKEMVFKKGDIVSVDCGVYYKGFHSDSSFSVGVEPDRKLKSFLEAGETALKKAINEAKIGNYIYDISAAMETALKGSGLTPVRALVGHGVGRELHEDPQVPCFTYGKRSDSLLLEEGFVLAIEVMYTQGREDLVLESDGWTISTSDGKISGLFEETVAVTKKGPMVLTNTDWTLGFLRRKSPETNK
jgi:methionyl aminopeptidase